VLEKLVGDYEETGDMVIRLLALEGRHAAIGKVMEFGRAEHRRWVAGAFEKQLGKLKAKGRERAVDALVVVTDVYVWKLMRRDIGRGVGEAKAMIGSMIDAVMAQFM
jgi:hypothetical protein